MTCVFAPIGRRLGAPWGEGVMGRLGVADGWEVKLGAADCGAKELEGLE